jgi:hypothetical protein
VLLLGLALTTRVLFWQATADREWAYSAWYKGDAAVWLSYAEALHDDQPYELGLPLRPPGAAYLIAALWDGDESSLATVKAFWCLLGAVTVLLLYLILRRSFSFAVALTTGLLAAASTGLMILSTSLNNETPYLLLVVATIFLWHGMNQKPSIARLTIWSGLHALACLIRVEHALFFAASSLALVVIWMRAGSGRSALSQVARRVLIMAVVFILVCIPWHIKAWSAIHRFNTVPQPLSSPSEAMYYNLEQSLPPLTWSREAQHEREQLPAFCRRAASVFVAATVVHQGRQQVTAEDFGVLEQAFGYRPEPLSPAPFVALYGGLNFYLANNPHADGGFSLAPLDDPPPLTGGIESYPRALVQGLPPRNLSFAYPPHLQAVNQGYAKGWQWLSSNPGRAIQLIAGKLRAFWSGASLGLTGYNLPLGMDGIRKRVDLVIPESNLGVGLWQVAVLVLCSFGLVSSWRSPALLPWLLLLASKVVIIIPFFGYARHGASVIPVVLLLVCLAVQHLSKLLKAGLAERYRHRQALITIALVLVLGGIELGRYLQQPTPHLDGRAIAAHDTFPVQDHEVRKVTVE